MPCKPVSVPSWLSALGMVGSTALQLDTSLILLITRLKLTPHTWSGLVEKRSAEYGIFISTHQPLSLQDTFEYHAAFHELLLPSNFTMASICTPAAVTANWAAFCLSL